MAEAVQSNKLVVASVLSGNRNFEGRINSLVRANYLASPPLVVAYAIAGRVDIDLVKEPLGTDDKGKKIFLKDIWPTQEEVNAVVKAHVRGEMFQKQYSEVFAGRCRTGRVLKSVEGESFEWDDTSTYIKTSAVLRRHGRPQRSRFRTFTAMRLLAMLGDSVTTDHISPAGSIPVDTPGGAAT